MDRNLMFDQTFSKQNFKDYFRMKLAGRAGGGVDRLTPDKFFDIFGLQIDKYIDACLESHYRFTKYNERLILKGRNRYPRVISIPTVRDRLVLGVLNNYLQVMMPELVCHSPVNQLISRIQRFRNSHRLISINYLKTDFSGFYDNIDHERLWSLIEVKNLDPRAVILIKNAVLTPTLNLRTRGLEIPVKGIPQGLAISNILSALYLESVDKKFSKIYDFYIRYVDDILILDSKSTSTEIVEQLKDFIKTEDLHLEIHPEKLKTGELCKDPFDFLGYTFNGNLTSVRKDSYTTFLNRIAKECTNFRHLYNHPLKRPAYLKNDDKFLTARIELLNLSITGIRVNGKYYGWVHHYQQIEDTKLLGMMDRLIRAKMLNFLTKEQRRRVASLSKVYYAIYNNNVDQIIFDYDLIDDVEKMKAFLIRKGYLDPEREYEDEEIRNYFISKRDAMRRRMEAHIGGIS